MPNIALLKEKISESGIKMTVLSEKTGITRDYTIVSMKMGNSKRQK